MLCGAIITIVVVYFSSNVIFLPLLYFRLLSTIEFIKEGCREVRGRRAASDNNCSDLEGSISGILRREIN